MSLGLHFDSDHNSHDESDTDNDPDSDDVSDDSFSSDFDPEGLPNGKIITPRPSLTELQGILSKLDLDEEFMLANVKKEMNEENASHDSIGGDSDDHKLEPDSDDETENNHNDKRRTSEPLIESAANNPNSTDDVVVKHTDSISMIRKARGKLWYVNQYLCYKFLGKGAFGKVCLAKDVASNKKFAIKVLNKSVLRRKRVWHGKKKPATNMLENIFREIAIMKKLKHPNVMQIYEVIDDPQNDKLMMVIDYMDHGSVLGAKGAEAVCDPMSDHELVRAYVRDMILGLDYLHANGVIHGDIKPENLLLSSEGHLKIADFGVSFMLDAENCPNADGKIKRAQGTPAFTAPEAGNKGSFDAFPIDVWALGVTLYMMVTGICPFAGNGIYDTYDKIKSYDPPIPDDIGANLHDFLTRILQKDPSQRITLKQAMQHPWITNNGADALQHPHSFENTAFVKRVSITQQDIEYAVSLPSQTITHLRQASNELQKAVHATAEHEEEKQASATSEEHVPPNIWPPDPQLLPTESETSTSTPVSPVRAKPTVLKVADKKAAKTTTTEGSSNKKQPQKPTKPVPNVAQSKTNAKETQTTKYSKPSKPTKTVPPKPAKNAKTANGDNISPSFAKKRNSKKYYKDKTKLDDGVKETPKPKNKPLPPNKQRKKVAACSKCQKTNG